MNHWNTWVELDLQVGYSSPSQSGIMGDLSLTVAEVGWFLQLEYYACILTQQTSIIIFQLLLDNKNCFFGLNSFWSPQSSGNLELGNYLAIFLRNDNWGWKLFLCNTVLPCLYYPSRESVGSLHNQDYLSLYFKFASDWFCSIQFLARYWPLEPW